MNTHILSGSLSASAGVPLPPVAHAPFSEAWQHAKFMVFDRVIEQLETRGQRAEALGAQPLLGLIEASVAQLGSVIGLALNGEERTQLAEDVRNEMTGFGPLEPLLADPAIDDIIVNGPHAVYVERAGRLAPVPARFRNDAHLMNIIQRIVSPIGRRVDETTPFVDARLPDGSRVNIVVPPVALDGPMVSIRKFKRQRMRPDDFVRAGAMSGDMLDYLSRAVRARLNILVCGGTGSGKTTLLNMLSGFIDGAERLITIEDAAELQLDRAHVVRLETRPPNMEGANAISPRDLVRNALRMRPDRIILGEVRGAEAIEMLQAMSTGHDGSMATIHANSPRDVFGRLEMLLGFAGMAGDGRAFRRYLASAVNIVVHLARMGNGQRRITSIVEVTGVESESYSLNPVHAFEEQPPLSGLGRFRTLSRLSFFAERMGDGGIARPAIGPAE